MIARWRRDGNEWLGRTAQRLVEAAQERRFEAGGEGGARRPMISPMRFSPQPLQQAQGFGWKPQGGKGRPCSICAWAPDGAMVPQAA